MILFAFRYLPPINFQVVNLHLLLVFRCQLVIVPPTSIRTPVPNTALFLSITTPSKRSRWHSPDSRQVG